MVEEKDSIEDILIRIEKVQESQEDLLNKIKNWIVFFGILVICGLLLSFCSVLLS